MDRIFVYPGAVPLETDILNTNRNTMVAFGKLFGSLFGNSTVANGLSVVPTGPASLQVLVNPGEVYSLQNVDATAYSSLAADTAHQIVKQGILADAATLNCPAPGTAGQSINYLVQATYSDIDKLPIALPYYNASNPGVAWSGPNNTGTQQNTVRSSVATVTVKAGTAATSGTQTTPAPDAGYIGLYMVTVANGQTQINAGNIQQLPGAALLGPAGVGLTGNLRGSFLTFSASATLTVAQSGQIVEVTGSATTLTLPTATNIQRGITFYLLNSAGGTVTVVPGSANFYGGGNINAASFKLSAGMSAIVTWDGSNWIITSMSGGAFLLGSNGYQLLSSGLLIQWGSATSNATPGNATAVTFPVAFPNGVLSVMTTALNASGSTTSSWIDSATTTGFNLRCNVASITNDFYAIGY